MPARVYLDEYQAFLNEVIGKNPTSNEPSRQVPVKIPCFPVGPFPATTASGRRFRYPAFCSVIRPDYFAIERSDGSNVLLQMGELRSWVARELGPHPLARPPGPVQAVLHRVKELWSAYIVPWLSPRDPTARGEEFLLTYFYEALFGRGESRASREARVQLWRSRRSCTVDAAMAEDRLIKRLLQRHHTSAAPAAVLASVASADSSLDAICKADQSTHLLPTDQLLDELRELEPVRGLNPEAKSWPESPELPPSISTVEWKGWSPWEASGIGSSELVFRLNLNPRSAPVPGTNPLNDEECGALKELLRTLSIPAEG